MPVGKSATVPSVFEKHFTAEQANAMLPLVRAIVQDITVLAHELKARHDRITRLKGGERLRLSEAHEEELLLEQKEFERGQERMREYEKELHQLGVHLKDYFTGLLDFPCWMDGREVFLCWRLGEPSVAHWHELEAGFAGRKKLQNQPQRV